MRTLREWDEAYSDDQGIWPLWSTGYDLTRPRWEIVREFSPLSWALAVGVQRQVGWRDIPNCFLVGVQVGPWALTLRREWPEKKAV